MEYRYIPLPNNEYLQIKYDVDCIVFDRFDADDNHIQSYGYDEYNEIESILNINQ